MKDAISGPPQCNACHLKSLTGSITAHKGLFEEGIDSAQYPLTLSKMFVFL